MLNPSNKVSSQKIIEQNFAIDFSKVQPITEVQIYSCRVKEVETGKEVLALAVKSGITVTEPIEIPTSKLKKQLPLIADYGFPIVLNYVKELTSLLQNAFNILPRLYCYSNLGWRVNADGMLYFHGSELVPLDNEVTNPTPNPNMGCNSPPNMNDGNQLVVVNDFKAGPRKGNDYILSDSSSHLRKAGSLQESIDFINQILHEKLTAQIILATGFSSMIVGLLKHSSVILNICGESSIGKSIMSELATSIYSTRNDYKITATFDSTPKALEALLHNNNGVVVVIDDTSTGHNNEHDIGRLIYNLAKGVNRKRLEKNYKINSPLNWHTSIITSSEISMLNTREKDKLGILRRCIELQPGQSDIIENAEIAESIKKFTSRNYGLLSTSFIEGMQGVGLNTEKIDSLFEEEKKNLQKLSNKMNADKQSARGIHMGYTETAAHITLAALLANELLGLNFDVNGMREYLIESGSEMIESFEEVSPKIPYEQAYQELCNSGEQFRKFQIEEDYINIPVKIFNLLEKNMGYRKFELRHYLQENNFLYTDKGNSGKTINGVGKCVCVLKTI